VLRIRVWQPDELLATWFWLATGSGVWLHLGRAVVVDYACSRVEFWRLVHELRQTGKYETAQLPTTAFMLPTSMVNSRFEIVD